jgi:hypothetical protein
MTPDKKDVLSKWFNIFSPCFIVMLFSLGGIILCVLQLRRTEGWSMLIIPVLAITSIACFIGDRILKLIITTTGKLWIVQLITLFVAFLLLYIFYP